MKSRSSGSSEGSIDASVETSPVRPNGQTKLDDDGVSINDSHSKGALLQSERRERQRNTSSRRRPSNNLNWKPVEARNGSAAKDEVSTASRPSLLVTDTSEKDLVDEKMGDRKHVERRSWSRSPWAVSLLTLVVTFTGIALMVTILNSALIQQIDPKGCRMSYMRPSYVRLSDFDTEHTRFASKYSLYLYREQGVAVNNDALVSGIPVLFIPGNAGSYKQVRPIASEAATYFHDVLQHDPAAANAGMKNLDFFTVDFNEDFSAFHGQTLLDQAEYLNEAVRYILSLYLENSGRRDQNLPDPTSVIILGHSMGGIAARTMLIMPNYQSNSVNTILTMSAPHARPPVSFDSQMVQVYEDINNHWRHAYSQKWANNNPLWQVTLVSVAGGGLDTVVPSDYASVESIAPETHGFTVFTTGIPNVWTSMDHAAILWCDQFRKVIARALFDIVDTSRAAQTKMRAERMRIFKKWFLTGMEDIAEKSLRVTQPQILLTLDEDSNSILRLGERLVLRQLGEEGKANAHLIPVPPQGSADHKRFTLLTDTKLDHSGDNGKLEVLFCSIFPLQPGQTNMLFSMNMDLSGDSTGSTRLACKSAASDSIILPGSTQGSKLPFFRDGEAPISPFSYLQYDLEDIGDHQFVAIVDKAMSPTQGWVIAEFSDTKRDHSTKHISLQNLISFGMQFQLPPNRPLVTEVRIPSVQSSLLAYNLEISEQACHKQQELFAPLVRQFLSEPYESKYFVNAREAKISLHGVAPYIPPPLRARRHGNGVALQFWTDPTCDSSISVRLAVDPLASLGQLYMRYRTVFGAFPLLVVALVLRKQFRIYDSTGIFIPFLESLDTCLRQSLPLLLLSLTLLGMSTTGQPEHPGTSGLWLWRNNTAAVDYAQNDLLIGSTDPFFWFMIPMIGLICIGVCTVLHYAALLLTAILSVAYGWIVHPTWSRPDDKRRGPLPMFIASSPKRRLITTGILLFLVLTFIPYQFAYLVACLVQLSTTVRAQRSKREMPSPGNSNFYNYAHSVFLLMLWVLPINLPTLVVWVRNLAVQWFTPFSSHHNVLSILPFILLVETLTTGRMVPRVTGRVRHLTSILLFGIAVYAAIYGVSHAYMLHYLVNIVAAWLVAIHSTSDSWSFAGLSSVLLDSDVGEDRKQRKTP